MTEKIDESDLKKFNFGVIGDPPVALVVQIPIAEYANQGPDGLDMFYGKMKRTEAMGANLIRQAFERKQKQTGIIKANLAVQ